jgi:hypothetical protein
MIAPSRNDLTFLRIKTQAQRGSFAPDGADAATTCSDPPRMKLTRYPSTRLLRREVRSGCTVYDQTKEEWSQWIALWNARIRQLPAQDHSSHSFNHSYGLQLRSQNAIQGYEL